MYSAAARLTPEDVYDASRMAVLEMALSGITTVGEFHYLHNAPDGRAYDDRISCRNRWYGGERMLAYVSRSLRVAYARSGYATEQNPHRYASLKRIRKPT